MQSKLIIALFIWIYIAMDWKNSP